MQHGFYRGLFLPPPELTYLSTSRIPTHSFSQTDLFRAHDTACGPYTYGEVISGFRPQHIRGMGNSQTSPEFRWRNCPAFDLSKLNHRHCPSAVYFGIVYLVQWLILCILTECAGNQRGKVTVDEDAVNFVL